MECEVKKEGAGETECMLSVLEAEVKAATDLLLLTNFSACLETCHHVISAVQACENCGPGSQDRLDKIQETATVIGIQALAEQGTWREVIPFVEHVYAHMAACPATIMQMCLLLHSHVREYMMCHSLVDAWLEWDNHRHLSESAAIVTTYVANVLVPLRAYNLIPQIVERCTVLSSEERQALLSPRIPSSPQMQFGQMRRLSDSGIALQTTAAVLETETGLTTSEPKDDGNKHKGVQILSMYVNLARQLWRTLAKKGWCQQLRKASKLFVFISFVLLALLHVQTDVTANFARAMELWRTGVGALFSLWRRHPHKL